MKAFKLKYIKKCKELHVEPIPSIVNLPESAQSDENLVLDLGELTLGQKNTMAIGYALEEDDVFSEIILSESYMGDEGCIAICNSLSKNKTCKLLNLKGGNIHAKGAAAIRRLLKANNTLQTLILEWNNIGVYENGINEIANALKLNRSLTSKY